MSITLYHMPGACSRVTMAALEETGVPYEDKLVLLARGDQREPAYLALNAKGKVPTLVVDGEPLVENAAILFYLARTFPDAGLLPRGMSDVADLRGLSDLIWCSGTLHPILHRFFRSGLYTQEGGEAGVKAKALAGLHENAAKIAQRVADGRWWYGDAWSIVDTYLGWILRGAERCGFPLQEMPELIEHGERVEARPAYRRTMTREAEALGREDSATPAP